MLGNYQIDLNDLNKNHEAIKKWEQKKEGFFRKFEETHQKNRRSWVSVFDTNFNQAKKNIEALPCPSEIKDEIPNNDALKKIKELIDFYLGLDPETATFKALSDTIPDIFKAYKEQILFCPILDFYQAYFDYKKNHQRDNCTINKQAIDRINNLVDPLKLESQKKYAFESLQNLIELYLTTKNITYIYAPHTHAVKDTHCALYTAISMVIAAYEKKLGFDPMLVFYAACYETKNQKELGHNYNYIVKLDKNMKEQVLPQISNLLKPSEIVNKEKLDDAFERLEVLIDIYLTDKCLINKEVVVVRIDHLKSILDQAILSYLTSYLKVKGFSSNVNSKIHNFIQDFYRDKKGEYLLSKYHQAFRKIRDSNNVKDIQDPICFFEVKRPYLNAYLAMDQLHFFDDALYSNSISSFLKLCNNPLSFKNQEAIYDEELFDGFILPLLERMSIENEKEYQLSINILNHMLAALEPGIQDPISSNAISDQANAKKEKINTLKGIIEKHHELYKQEFHKRIDDLEGTTKKVEEKIRTILTENPSLAATNSNSITSSASMFSDQNSLSKNTNNLTRRKSFPSYN